MFAWLVKHRSYFPIKLVVRTDGKTASERELGRKDRRQVCVFFHIFMSTFMDLTCCAGAAHERTHYEDDEDDDTGGQGRLGPLSIFELSNQNDVMMHTCFGSQEQAETNRHGRQARERCACVVTCSPQCAYIDQEKNQSQPLFDGKQQSIVDTLSCRAWRT